jgi:hypothetical protein
MIEIYCPDWFNILNFKNVLSFRNFWLCEFGVLTVSLNVPDKRYYHIDC